MNLPARKKYFALAAALALFVAASGCAKKEKPAAPEVQEVRLEEISLFQAPGDSSRWLAYLAPALQDTARAWLLLGVLYLANDKPETALVYFNLAEKSDPGRPVVQLNIGDAYNRMRQFDKATEAFREYLHRKPQSQFAPEIFRIIQKYRSIESEKLIP
jgi:predicted Zn-dependent protease